MHSEEVVKLNVALRYCDQLKNNLQASILHVQMLNRKYNTTTEYNSPSFSTSFCGSPQRNRSSLQPEHNDDQPPIKKKQIRSIGDIKQNFNNIIVNGIKLRREVETTSTKLKLIGDEHRLESTYSVKKRIQLVNGSHASPSSSSGCRHGRCFQNSPYRNGSRDRSRSASAKKTHQSINTSTTNPQTPPSSQRKRIRKSLHNQLVAVQLSANVKKSRIQSSTPIKINEPTSNSNRSHCSPLSSVMKSNNSSCLSKQIADDDDTMNSPIRPCFRNPSDDGLENDSPKRICWTPIVKVKRISIYQ